ncbi:MAG: DNA starvation/stationary phase protection protein [Kineosporiaceae bacterium]
MAPQIRSTLSETDQAVVGAALNTALADLVDLHLVGKQAHWNLIGRNFRSLHLQLDEVVDTARQYADLVAERAVTLGVPADGRATTIATASGMPTYKDGFVTDTDTIGYFVDALGSVIARLREGIAATEEPDPVSQDLLIEVTANLEKHYWMFQAEQ